MLRKKKKPVETPPTEQAPPAPLASDIAADYALLCHTRAQINAARDVLYIVDSGKVRTGGLWLEMHSVAEGERDCIKVKCNQSSVRRTLAEDLTTLEKQAAELEAKLRKAGVDPGEFKSQPTEIFIRFQQQRLAAAGNNATASSVGSALQLPAMLQAINRAMLN